MLGGGVGGFIAMEAWARRSRRAPLRDRDPGQSSPSAVSGAHSGSPLQLKSLCITELALAHKQASKEKGGTAVDCTYTCLLRLHGASGGIAMPLRCTHVRK